MDKGLGRIWWTLGMALVAACAAEPYADKPADNSAFIQAGLRSETRRELPVLLHAIDGQVLLKYRAPVPVSPGKHSVDVYFSSGAVAGAAEKHRRTVEIDAAPCTRYLIVARYTHPVTTSVEWEPVVYPEKIGDCPGR